MSRTTVDIDDPILRELKRLQKREGKSLGELVSSLLADALFRRKAASTADATSPPRFAWESHDMGTPRVDIDDKEALWRALDSEEPS